MISYFIVLLNLKNFHFVRCYHWSKKLCDKSMEIIAEIVMYRFFTQLAVIMY